MNISFYWLSHMTSVCPVLMVTLAQQYYTYIVLIDSKNSKVRITILICSL